MYLTLQLPDSDEEDPFYKTNRLVVELILDKETITNVTEKGESTKTHTAQTVAQQCNLLDTGDYLEMETEAEQPVAYY